ncbi:MAG: outer membrane protein assembly factor BamE [Gammaproteobacteria bacterium]|nr:outer membrane protein assembly factor BamE [Gammaproteobacteria bacterium]
MRKLLILIVLTATYFIGGCSGKHIPFVHKIDIPQGNIITQEMMNKLEPGLDKQKVRYILGTPLIIDVFHQEEWVYLYSFQPGGEERTQRRVSLFFEKDMLQRIGGDIRPATGRTNETVKAKPSTLDVPAGAGSDEDGGFLRSLIDRFNSWRSTENEEQKAAPTTEKDSESSANGDDISPPSTPESAPDNSQNSVMQRYSLHGDDIRNEDKQPLPTEPIQEESEAKPASEPVPEQPSSQTTEDPEKDENEEGLLQRLKRGLGYGDQEGQDQPQAEGPLEQAEKDRTDTDAENTGSLPDGEPGDESKESFLGRLKQRFGYGDGDGDAKTDEQTEASKHEE